MSSPSVPTQPLIVALDYPQRDQALAMASQLDPTLCRVKVGKELFTRAGPELVRELHARGFQVFLDLKFHDIPNTVAGAVSAAAELGVWMVNVHAAGGPEMMGAARRALDSFGADAPLLIAVTVLTSMDGVQLAATGVTCPPAEQVIRLATLARDHGLDGAVCSAQESTLLRDRLGNGFVQVTPGIRPAGADQDDQERIATPRAALAAGSHYLVIGRPITRSENPSATLAAISREIADGPQ